VSQWQTLGEGRSTFSIFDDVSEYVTGAINGTYEMALTDNPPVDICDQIDELVNDQLANYPQRSGYDFPVNQDKCWHCRRQWHGLKITARMEMMRQAGRYDESYRYDTDDSSVICPGSEFIGPIPSQYSPKWLNYLIEISEQYGLETWLTGLTDDQVPTEVVDR
jgi:hypothetical protein